ncbi:hypothetical protein P171DRAFT_488158 [Karstenula rhodostoma CBS 690.94]|uniref:Uncharacterized protein n=1 Tax=Karstenula rhodostoma CBS 690.94 TaxID=1392251 RepID=A0A9P4PB12_9PLEO|nr:hypothetical protein P171DRAFT_488158 [Karstenula rhodostoma CBS 690.94]
MMTALSGAQAATHYDATLVLKGFHTMLIPTKRESDTITWHLLVEYGGRIPYYIFKSKCGMHVDTDTLDIYQLQDGEFRHFVGWTTDAARCLGTQDVPYASINWAGAKKCAAGFAIEQKITLSASKFVGVGGSFVRGNRDKPEYIKHSAYSMQVDASRDMFVMLYDTSAKRGWFTDGASALLHLTLTQIAWKGYDTVGSAFNNTDINSSQFEYPGISDGPDAAVQALKKESNMKHIVLKEFDSYTDAVTLASNESDVSARQSSPERKQIYKTVCFRELVSQNWTTLEQIYDRAIEQRTTHTIKQMHSPFSKMLEGYEFMDFVSGKHALSPRFVNLRDNGPSWVGLLERTDAITLFGQGFGDLYKPTERLEKRICKDWRTVPAGHEYLAVPLSLLKQIKEHGWREGEVDAGTSEIAYGIWWDPHPTMAVLCGPNCEHALINRVQVLCTKCTNFEKFTWSTRAFAHRNGAIIFGQSSLLDQSKLEANLRVRDSSNKGSSHDSGLGSSLEASSDLTPSSLNISTNGSYTTISHTPSAEQETVVSTSTLGSENMQPALSAHQITAEKQPFTNIPLADGSSPSNSNAQQATSLAARLKRKSWANSARKLFSRKSK